MKKLINKLLFNLCKFADFKSKKTAANYLILLFNDTKFFKKNEITQKEILNNLLSYFDTIIYNSDTKKVTNKIDANEIKKHIIYKVTNLCNYPQKLY